MEEKRNAWVSHKERDHWADQGVNGWIILRWILERYDGVGCVGCTGLAQEMNKWRALVNAVMSLRLPYNAGRFSSGCITGGL
jgi:hypothetical protein